MEPDDLDLRVTGLCVDGPMAGETVTLRLADGHPQTVIDVDGHTYLLAVRPAPTRVAVHRRPPRRPGPRRRAGEPVTRRRCLFPVRHATLDGEGRAVMRRCVRPGCSGDALAPWWGLCTACTTPLMTARDGGGAASRDQQLAAGWDALEWAERIAPGRWGHAVDDDLWTLSVRCLTFAAVVTGRAQGCVHTAAAGASVPVVAVVRAPTYLYCPVCAEAVVATVTVDGLPCDRCRRVTVPVTSRVAALAGASLIVVAQLCDGCAGAMLALGPSTADGLAQCPADG